MQKIAIIDYGSGNLRSVEKAFERAARESGFAAQFDVTDDPALIAAADRIVLPGVGAFGACIDGLRARQGVLETIEKSVLSQGRPFLGICVGMQLLAERGLEYGAHDGLGWIAGEVKKALASGDPDFRTPHMGWNELRVSAPHPLLDGLDGESFYFAHSYCFDPVSDAHVIGFCRYGVDFTAAVSRDNIAGVQFHPEKSQRAGMKLLSNFLRWRPA